MRGKNMMLGLVLALAVAGAARAGADRIDTSLTAAINGPAFAVTDKPVVSVGNFTYAEKKIGSGFSRYLTEKLGVALSSSSRYEYFDRDKLDDVLQAAKLSLNDLFDQSTVKQVNFKGIEAVFSGTFLEADPYVIVYLQLNDVGSGTSLGRAEVKIAKADVPDTIAIRPDNYSDALYVMDELKDAQSADAKGLVVKAWTPRGNGGTYRDGEKLVINFFSNRDCYLRIYHIDVKKATKLIFPNAYYRQDALKAGKIYSIPDASYPFDFALSAPYGTEFIKVVASTVPFTGDEAVLEDLGEASREIVTRGLNVTKKEALRAEVLLSYTIVR